MELLDWRLLVDFGFTVLIWMVQLVIYPSFIYFAPTPLERWHAIYTKSITFIVAPLMFLQTGLIALQCLYEISFYTLSSLVLIIALWLFTFFEAVPLHQKIQFEMDKKVSCNLLVIKNKKRTALWTILFILSLMIKLGV